MEYTLASPIVRGFEGLFKAIRLVMAIDKKAQVYATIFPYVVLNLVYIQGKCPTDRHLSCK